MTVERGVAGPNTMARRRRDRRARRAAWGLVVSVLLLAAFVVVTNRTGFPGPGSLRRYPIADLQAVADRINQSDCGDGMGWRPAQIASVDGIRSRVHLSRPESVVLAPEDRPLVDNVPADPFGTGSITQVRCVGHTVPG